MPPPTASDSTAHTPASSCIAALHSLLERYAPEGPALPSLAKASAKEVDRVTPDRKAKIALLYSQGMAVPGISKELGLAAASVTYHLKVLGLREPAKKKPTEI